MRGNKNSQILFIEFIKYLDRTFFYTYNLYNKVLFAKKFTANFWKFPDFLLKVSSGVISVT